MNDEISQSTDRAVEVRAVTAADGLGVAGACRPASAVPNIANEPTTAAATKPLILTSSLCGVRVALDPVATEPGWACITRKLFACTWLAAARQPQATGASNAAVMVGERLAGRRAPSVEPSAEAAHLGTCRFVGRALADGAAAQLAAALALCARACRPVENADRARVADVYAHRRSSRRAAYVRRALLGCQGRTFPGPAFATITR